MQKCFGALSARAVSCASAIGLFLAADARAGVSYEVTRIPTPAESTTSAALGVNASGEAVGYWAEGNNFHAFFYSHPTGALYELASLGGHTAVACAINDAHAVSGYATDEAEATKAFLLSPDRPIAPLPAGPDSAASEGFAINPAGQVAGVVQDSRGQSRPVAFVGQAPRQLAEAARADGQDAMPSAAYGLNEAGDAVGKAKSAGGPVRAFLYSAAQGRSEELGALGGHASQAFGINRRGEVAGEAETTAGPVHAFLFAQGKMRDLGTLPGFEAASHARALNDGGCVVGDSEAPDGSKHAFVTEGVRLVDLNAVAINLADAGFASLDIAYGINARGWVVGYGTTKDGKGAAFLAVPNTPETAVWPPKADSYDAFYTQLSSAEGEWLDVGAYGHAFRPKVAVGSRKWRPYCDGHWVHTDHGWYWDSNESFGWATYHYGAWINVDGIGWCWIPGRHWAPAWVSWRWGEGCVGWAPLPPEAVCGPYEVTVTSSCDAAYGIGPGAYLFIPCDAWFSPSYAQSAYPDSRVLDVIPKTLNVTNVYAGAGGFHSYGVDAALLSQRLGRPVPRVALELAAATGLGVAYHAALAGNTLRVTAPGAHLAPLASVRPPLRDRILAPHPERGWTGVPPDRRGKLRQTLSGPGPVSPTPSSGGEPRLLGVGLPAPSTSVVSAPRPVIPFQHPGVVIDPQRHSSGLGPWPPLPPHLSPSPAPRVNASLMRPENAHASPTPVSMVKLIPPSKSPPSPAVDQSPAIESGQSHRKASESGPVKRKAVVPEVRNPSPHREATEAVGVRRPEHDARHVVNPESPGRPEASFHANPVIHQTLGLEQRRPHPGAGVAPRFGEAPEAHRRPPKPRPTPQAH